MTHKFAITTSEQVGLQLHSNEEWPPPKPLNFEGGFLRKETDHVIKKDVKHGL